MGFASVTTGAPVGVPLWAFLASLILTGGVGAALVQLLAARTAARAGARTVESSANLIDVQALSNTVASLAAENTRLINRLTGSQAMVDDLRVLLEKEPTKEKLLDSLDKLRSQLVEAGEVPVNGLPKKP